MQTLDDLLNEYWDLAYKEGEEGRTHDTRNGDASRVRALILDNFIAKEPTVQTDALTSCPNIECPCCGQEMEERSRY